MANAKYDYLTEMLGAGDFNWKADHIIALLTKGVAFDAADKRVSEVLAQTGAMHVATSEVLGRYLVSDGSAIGLPAVFSTVPKQVDYQVLLAKDDGSADSALVAFYDEDQAAAKLRLLNNGTMIVRPVDIPGSENPVEGVWFKL